MKLRGVWNDLNGVPTSANRHALTGILRIKGRR